MLVFYLFVMTATHTHGNNLFFSMIYLVSLVLGIIIIPNFVIVPQAILELQAAGKTPSHNLIPEIHSFNLNFRESNVIIKNKTIKYESPLYRAQSLKICEADQTSQIFRPSDLYVGESLGEGFYGEVLKVQRNTSTRKKIK